MWLSAPQLLALEQLNETEKERALSGRFPFGIGANLSCPPACYPAFLPGIGLKKWQRSLETPLVSAAPLPRSGFSRDGSEVLGGGPPTRMRMLKRPGSLPATQTGCVRFFRKELLGRWMETYLMPPFQIRFALEAAFSRVSSYLCRCESSLKIDSHPSARFVA